MMMWIAMCGMFLFLFSLHGSSKAENMDFAIKLYSLMSEKYPSQNVLVSPVGVEACLATLFAGATGKTAAEIANILNTSGQFEDSKYKFQIDLRIRSDTGFDSQRAANKIYVNKSIIFYDDFLNNIFIFNKFRYQSLDFTATDSVDKINNWVAEETKNQITEIINPSDIKSETKALLVNAITLFNKFSFPFNESLTSSEVFLANNRFEMFVKMMHQLDSFKYYSSSALKARVLMLQFDANKWMYIILPMEKGATQLSFVEAAIKRTKLRNVLRKHEEVPYSLVNVSLPRFRLHETGRPDISDVLKGLGARKVFQDDAELSAVGEGDVVISKVFQKLLINVNEGENEGRKRFHLKRPSMKSEVIQFRVNYPFLVGITDDYFGVVYFMARVVNP